MRINKVSTSVTIFLFIFFIFSSSLTSLYSKTKDEDKEISNLYKKAEEMYENGNFNQAIEIYEQIIDNLNKKKELAKTKQKLFKTMVSLALTLFTIQQTEKAKSQLEKLISLNPNEELDKEIYPPDFIKIFDKVRRDNLGSIFVKSTPPGAEILIDNKSYGKTPLKIKNFNKGEYIMTASLKGYTLYTKKIKITENNNNTFLLNLLKKGRTVKNEGVIEKQEIKKKKKRSPVLLIAGGAIVAGALILLLLKKKNGSNIQSKTFAQKDSTVIGRIISYSSLEVSGITGKIQRIEYNVVVEHPKIEDLAINLVAQDNRTIFNIWNKGNHQDNGKTFNGSTQIFNSIAPNGLWKIAVTNSGDRKNGKIVKWQLKIFYTTK